MDRIFPLLFTVITLFPMGFFLLSSPPLLILKHETPMDGRVIRTLFNVCYLIIIGVSGTGAVANAVVGRTTVALALGSLCAFVFFVRRAVLGRMDRLRDQIAGGDRSAVQRFRRTHLAGMALNLAQLGTVGWAMTRMVA